MHVLNDQRKETTAVERVFQAREENIAGMLEFVEGALEEASCPLKTQTAIAVAMEEIFVNISRYAYGSGVGTAKISIRIDPDTRNATFVVTDTGVAFNPLEKPDPDITLPAEEREVGGLGIFIIKKTMDSVAYARENGENRLTMIKNLEGRVNA